MRLVAILLLTLGATIHPSVAHACRVLPWEVRPGETSQSAIMRRDQERLTPRLKANALLARVVSVERGSTGLHVVFEPIGVARGTAPSRRLTAYIDGSCYPVYDWRVGESAILYLDRPGPAEVALAVPPRQNIDPTITRDLRVLAANLRQSLQ